MLKFSKQQFKINFLTRKQNTLSCVNIILCSKILSNNFQHNSIYQHLNSDSHIYEDFCQIKIFPSLVQKNTIICLSGV